MSDLPVHLLESLASEAEQIRYIVGGTKDEYLLPDGLVNDAHHFCERIKAPKVWATLGAKQRQAVLQLELALNQRGGCLDRYTHATIADLVQRDPDWAALREAARDVMRCFGVAPPA
jgi:hypothetical protein